MIPMHCPATPHQEASLSFHPWPAHLNPRSFWLVKAKRHQFPQSFEI